MKATGLPGPACSPPEAGVALADGEVADDHKDPETPKPGLGVRGLGV